MVRKQIYLLPGDGLPEFRGLGIGERDFRNAHFGGANRSAGSAGQQEQDDESSRDDDAVGAANYVVSESEDKDESDEKEIADAQQRLWLRQLTFLAERDGNRNRCRKHKD